MAKKEFNGSRFEFIDSGDGDPVVFVHGSASDYRSWQFQEELFAQSYRTFSYSRRYHWPNEVISEEADYAMSEHLDDLRQLLELVSDRPVHLVGHSYGAFLCLLVSLQEPSLVRSLVLAEPPVITLFVSKVPKPLELLRLLVSKPRTAAAIVRFGAMGVGPATKAFKQGDMQKGVKTFGDAVFGSGGYERLTDAAKLQVQDNRTNVQAELLGSGFASLDAEELCKLQVPTLLVSGQDSIALFQYMTDYLEELLLNAERVIIPQASHMMHADNPAAYNAAVLAFLQKH